MNPPSMEEVKEALKYYETDFIKCGCKQCRTVKTFVALARWFTEPGFMPAKIDRGAIVSGLQNGRECDAYKTPPAGGVGFVSKFYDPIGGLGQLVDKLAGCPSPEAKTIELLREAREALEYAMQGCGCDGVEKCRYCLKSMETLIRLKEAEG